ncbi:MAG: NfeD family protein [Magnetococcales bacterium]|nr:NfeD family protein [Magnetococcales bacterium]
MESLLSQVEHWHWWILSVLLIILEILVPAVFFLWLGIAAGLVGGLLLLFPEMGWKAQVLWFSGLAVASIGVWHGYLKKNPTSTDQPTLNRRGSQYIGRVFTLDEPIENGVGRIRVDDTGWKVSGPDLSSGAKVRVTGTKGTLLLVEAVSPTA